MSNKDLILIVEDEEKIAELVTFYLEKEGYAVLSTTKGQQALDIVSRHPVSLVLLDLMLPDMSGEEVCAALREHHDVPLIMMTAKADEQSVLDGLNGGADDYVTKPFSPRQLVARVEAVLRRSVGQHDRDQPRTLRSGSILVDVGGRLASKGHEPLELTGTEFRILVLLMERPHRTFTRSEIMEHVGSDEGAVFDRTIDTHIKNIRRKIEDSTKEPRYLKTVYGLGYRWEMDVH